MDISTKIERFRKKLKSVVDSDYKCLVCDIQLKEFITTAGELKKLYIYQSSEIQYCRECFCKISLANRIMSENSKWLNLLPKNDSERAIQLQVLEAKELLHLINCLESDPNQREKYTKCYHKNLERLTEPFIYRQIMI